MTQNAPLDGRSKSPFPILLLPMKSYLTRSINVNLKYSGLLESASNFVQITVFICFDIIVFFEIKSTICMAQSTISTVNSAFLTQNLRYIKV